MSDAAPPAAGAPSTSSVADEVSRLSLNGAAESTPAQPIASTSTLPPTTTVEPLTSPVKSRDYAALMTASTARPAGPSPVVTPALGSSPPSSSTQGPPTTSRTSPAGNVGSLRARTGQGSSQNVRLPPSLQAKMAAMANRPGKSASPLPTTLSSTDRLDASALLNSSSANASAAPVASTSASPAGGPAAGGLAKRRPGPPMTLSAMGAGAPNGRMGANGLAPGGPPARRGPPGGGLKLNQSDMAGGTPFSNFAKIVDPSGKLNFDNKAVLHASGVDFSNGSSFSINMGDLTLLGELGKGNYGTVQKVFHKVTKVTMAMKEIRLELDDSKLKAIITELDILHRATAPQIVDFYGAFFIESCVYYCMEFMDAGSLDKLAGVEVPEDVLARVTSSTVRGLKFLKDELQTMHRDVKPTNVLINRAGAIKLCDFGVSGQLERSLAKTNIGCQPYMAPERIKGESQGQATTYTVSSDVWSLGLTIIEFSVGHYPYPPETHSNVLAQLQAIVHGEPPGLPAMYSSEAADFVKRCLQKDPHRRATYAEMLEHPFLRADVDREVNMVGWVAGALQARAERYGISPSSPSSSPSSSSSNNQL